MTTEINITHFGELRGFYKRVSMPTDELNLVRMISIHAW